MKNLIYILFLLLVFSCDEAFLNSGDVILKNIEIEEFNELYIKDIFEVFLIQDSVCKIEVKAGSNLIPNLEFNVDENNILTIYDNNSANWSRDYEKIKLYISVDSLRFLRLDAPSKVVTQNKLITPELKVMSITDFSEIDIDIQCGNFYLVNSEPSGGIINLSGSSNSLNFWARGSLQVNAENFAVHQVNVNSESIGDCYVNADQNLRVKIIRSGNVYYRGNPSTIEYVNEEAKDQLIKID